MLFMVIYLLMFMNFYVVYLYQCPSYLCLSMFIIIFTHVYIRVFRDKREIQAPARQVRYDVRYYSQLTSVIYKFTISIFLNILSH